MSASHYVFDLIGSFICSLSPAPFDANCPSCAGSLRWAKFFGPVKRVYCPDCKREWVKEGRAPWALDMPHNPT
jgi:hypothetical protein